MKENIIKKTNIRETWIDILKGILMLFVILGHSTESIVLKNILSSFYMPCFFILSGWLMKKQADTKTFIYKKVKTILLPYFCFALLWVLFCFFKNFVVESDFNLFRALLSIFIPYSGSLGGNAYNLWFLPCLFLSQVLLAVFLYKNIIWKIITALLWVAFLLLGIFITPYCSLLYAAAVATVFVAVGYLLSNYVFYKMNLKSWLIFLLTTLLSAMLYICCLILNVFIAKNNLDFSSATFGVLPIYIIGAVFCSLFLILIIQKIKGVVALEYVGKNSLVYYALHYEVLTLTSFVIEKLIYNAYLQTALIFLITLVLTTIVVFIYNRLNIGKLFRYS